MNKWITTLCLVGILSLTACGPQLYSQDELEKQTAKELYIHAEMALARKDFPYAVNYLESLNARFPFSLYARKAQLSLIYGYYKAEDYEAALATASNYIQLYPRDEHADYAYYMRGLINLRKDRTWMQDVFGLIPAMNDVTNLKHAFTNFKALLQYYPHSPYAADAHRRMAYIRNQVATNELLAAEYYFKRRAYVAAANRSSYIVKHFQGAPQVINALHIMMESYQKLGLTESYKQTQNLLKKVQPTI